MVASARLMRRLILGGGVVDVVMSVLWLTVLACFLLSFVWPLLLIAPTCSVVSETVECDSVCEAAVFRSRQDRVLHQEVGPGVTIVQCSAK